MSAQGPLFWMLMGVIAVAIGGALWSFADRRGWVMTWWKWLLVVVWYGVFAVSFYAAGTLVGEFEPRAGLRVLLLGLFFCIVLGHTWIPVTDTPKTSWNVDKTGHVLQATSDGEVRFFHECVRCRERRPVTPERS